MAPLTVFYDADCGFCRWTLSLLLRWDRHGALLPLAIQSPDGERLLAPIAPAERMTSAHVVTPDGRVFSGGDAVPVIARRLPGGAPVALIGRVLGGPMRWGYRQIAENRTALSRHVPNERKDRAAAAIERHRRRAAGEILPG